MVLLRPCWACQRGNHDEHTETVQAAPPGLLGGVECPCMGECDDGKYGPAQFPDLLKALKDEEVFVSDKEDNTVYEPVRRPIKNDP